MKKFTYITIITVLSAAICLFGYLALSWFSLNKTDMPKTVNIAVNNTDIPPDGIDYSYPVFFGLLERDLSWAIDNVAPPKIVVQTAKVPIAVPAGYDSKIKIASVDSPSNNIFAGNINDYQSFSFDQEGDYIIDATLTKNRAASKPYGDFHYSSPLSVKLPVIKPVVDISTTSVFQGDYVQLTISNVVEGDTPTITSDLGKSPFVFVGDGKWVCLYGIGDSHDLGEYPIYIKCKDFTFEEVITVSARKFNRQDLQINTSSPTITQANSDKAYKQYRETIPPFYDTADTDLYWDGEFIQPVEGRISSEYGLLRYTNGSNKPRRHAGIDIAVASGTKIKAPADGKVVFSQLLLNTGNTLVIEHGGGLKTYYFHLSERLVNVGDTVALGDIIGKVGTTGYSTGPHLHFEVRIGNQNLDPFKFINSK